MQPEGRRLAASEMIRVTKPGGRIFVTADAAPWLPELFGFASGDFADKDFPLTEPPVYYVLVEK